MTESLITQEMLEDAGTLTLRERIPAGIIFGGQKHKIAMLRNFPVHKVVNGVAVPIDTRWQVGAGGEYGVETLAPRIQPSTNEITFKNYSFALKPFAVGTVTLNPLGFDLISTLPSGNVQGNQYIIEIGVYTYTVTLMERNRIKVDIVLPEKPPNLAGDYFVIANKVLDVDFFTNTIMEPNQIYKDVFMFNRGFASDAEQNQIEVKNIVREIGGENYILSGIPISWLDTAVYPIHIDPTTTLQPGSAGYDTYMAEATPTTNFGSSVELWTGIQNSDTRGVLNKFDLSSLDAVAVVNNAIWSLRCDYLQDAASAQTIAVQQILRNWGENTATWNTYDGSTSWTTAGAKGAGDANLISSYFAISTIVLNAFDDYSVTSAVQAWLVDGDPNYGFGLQTGGGVDATSGVRFASGDNATASYRPKLYIDYIARSPQPIWFA